MIVISKFPVRFGPDTSLKHIWKGLPLITCEVPIVADSWSGKNHLTLFTVTFVVNIVDGIDSFIWFYSQFSVFLLSLII